MLYETREAQRLWRAVLVQVLKDLARNTARSRNIRIEAERWIGTYPSSNFRFVCFNAGLDPACAFDWFRTICDAPVDERLDLIGDVLVNTHPIKQRRPVVQQHTRRAA